MSQPKSEFDSPWKSILDVYFEDCIKFFWPEKHAAIDWSRGYKSLDKELHKIARNAKIGNRVVDKLMEVYLKDDGQEAYILLHIEVQGDLDPDFEERMFIYHYRLRDLHRVPIASLAILIDRDEKWRPGCFREEFWETSIEIRFPIFKVIDYRDRVQELESSSNLFAQVMLAQLVALEKQLPEAKLSSKIGLIKALYGRGWKREDITNLWIFIDYVVALPPSLEQACEQAIKTFEEELHVNYVTSFERIGVERGIQQGVQIGEGNLLLRLLECKFKTVPEHYRQRIERASSDELLSWGEKVLESRALEDIFLA